MTGHCTARHDIEIAGDTIIVDKFVSLPLPANNLLSVGADDGYYLTITGRVDCDQDTAVIDGSADCVEIADDSCLPGGVSAEDAWEALVALVGTCKYCDGTAEDGARYLEGVIEQAAAVQDRWEADDDEPR